MKLTCPTKNRLREFLEGSVADADADQISDHVEDCQTCDLVLSTLENEQSDLLKELREGIRTERLLQEPEFEKLRNTARFSQADTTASADVDEHPQTGKRLRDYRLVKKIGEGGMGTVYQAFHVHLAKHVALKILPNDKLRSKQSVARFRQEMRAVGQVNHPNVVSASDAGTIDGQHFLVMELVQGADLARIIHDRGPLNVAEACEIVRQAAIGLQHAHDNGLVHRDVKPSNIMLTIDGSVKLLDLGLAGLNNSEFESTANVVVTDRLTSVGQIMGTLDYMAPEQITASPEVDGRADIYALGATLFQLLTGRTPCGDRSEETPQRIEAVLHKPPLDIRTLRNDVPEELCTLLLKMLAKKPEDRPVAAIDVANELTRFTSDADLDALAEECRTSLDMPSADVDVTDDVSFVVSRATQPQDDSSSNRPRTLIALAGFFLALVASVIFYIQTNNGVIRVKVLDDSLAVTIKGQVVELKDGDKTLTIRAGHHKLEVSHLDSDFKFLTDQFELKRNGEIAFEVDLLHGEVVVRQEGQSDRMMPLPEGARPPETDSAPMQAIGTEPRFELYFVEPRPMKGVTDRAGIKFGKGGVKFGSGPDQLVYLHVKPALVLNPSHVASIKTHSYSFAGTPAYSLDIELTDAARKQLAEVVEGEGDHMRHVTYVVDGKRRGGMQRYEINVDNPGGIPEICRAPTFSILFTASGDEGTACCQRIVSALQPETSTSSTPTPQPRVVEPAVGTDADVGNRHGDFDEIDRQLYGTSSGRRMMAEVYRRDPDAQESMAERLIADGKDEAARRVLSLVVPPDPKATAALNLAKLHEKAGDIEKASHAYLDAYRITPALLDDEHLPTIRKAGQVPRLVDVLTEDRLGQLPFFNSAESVVRNLLKDEATRDDGYRLLKRVWAARPGTHHSLLTFRTDEIWSAVPEPDYYLRSKLLPSDIASEGHGWDRFTVEVWGDPLTDPPVWGMPVGLKPLLNNKKVLRQLLKDVEAAIKEHPEWKAGPAVLCFLEAKVGEKERSVDLLKQVLADAETQPIPPKSAWIFGLALAGDDANLDQLVIKLLERSVQDWSEHGVLRDSPIGSLATLYSKYGRQAEARRLLSRLAVDEYDPRSPLAGDICSDGRIPANASRCTECHRTERNLLDVTVMSQKLTDIGYPVDALLSLYRIDSSFGNAYHSDDEWAKANTPEDFFDSIREGRSKFLPAKEKAESAITPQAVLEALKSGAFSDRDMTKRAPENAEIAIDLMTSVRGVDGKSVLFSPALEVLELAAKAKGDEAAIAIVQIDQLLSEAFDKNPDNFEAGIAATMFAFLRGDVVTAKARLQALDAVRTAQDREPQPKDIMFWLVAQAAGAKEETKESGKKFAELAQAAATKHEDALWRKAIQRSPDIRKLLTLATPEGIKFEDADIRISDDQSLVLVGKKGEHLLRIDDKKRTATAEPISGWRGMRFVPGTRHIVTKTWDHVVIRDPDQPLRDTPRMPHKMVEGDWINPAVSPNGKFVVTRPKLTHIRFWDPATLKPLGDPIEAGGHVARMHFTRDSKYLCVYAEAGLHLWNPNSGKRVAGPFPDGDYPIGMIGLTAYDPVGNRVATIDNNDHQQPVDLESRVIVRSILGNRAGDRAIKIPAHSRRVFWSGKNHLFVWGARKKAPEDVEGYFYDTFPLFLIMLEGDSTKPIELAANIYDLALTPDTRCLIGASGTETLCWKAGQTKPLWRTPGRAKEIMPTKEYVLLRGFGRTLKVRSVVTGDVLQDWDNKWAKGMATHLQGDRIWLFNEKEIEVWDAKSGAPQPPEHEGHAAKPVIHMYFQEWKHIDGITFHKPTVLGDGPLKVYTHLKPALNVSPQDVKTIQLSYYDELATVKLEFTKEASQKMASTLKGQQNRRRLLTALINRKEIGHQAFIINPKQDTFKMKFFFHDLKEAQRIVDAYSTDGKRAWTNPGKKSIDLHTFQEKMRVPTEGKTAFEGVRIYHAKAQLSRDLKTALVESGAILQVWNLETGQLTSISKWGGQGGVVGFVPEQNLAWHAKSRVEFWDLTKSARTKMVIPHSPGPTESEPIPPAISKDGKLLAARTDSGKFRLWNLQTQKPLSPEIEAGTFLYNLTFSPDGNWLFTKDKSGWSVWDVATQKRAVGPLLEPADQSTDIAVSPDSSKIATIEGKPSKCEIVIRVTEGKAWKEHKRIPLPNPVRQATWIDAQHLAVVVESGNESYGVKVISIDELEVQHYGYLRTFDKITVAPDRKHLVVSNYAAVTCWKLGRKEHLWKIGTSEAGRRHDVHFGKDWVLLHEKGQTTGARPAIVRSLNNGNEIFRREDVIATAVNGENLCLASKGTPKF